MITTKPSTPATASYPTLMSKRRTYNPLLHVAAPTLNHTVYESSPHGAMKNSVTGTKVSKALSSTDAITTPKTTETATNSSTCSTVRFPNSNVPHSSREIQCPYDIPVRSNSQTTVYTSAVPIQNDPLKSTPKEGFYNNCCSKTGIPLLRSHTDSSSIQRNTQKCRSPPEDLPTTRQERTTEQSLMGISKPPHKMCENLLRNHHYHQTLNNISQSTQPSSYLC